MSWNKKESEVFEEMPPLLPVDFFQVEAEVQYCKTDKLSRSFLLPNLSTLLNEEHFLDLSMGWNEKGLVLDACVHKPFEEAIYPAFAEGDALEIFIDTRALK